MIKLTIDGNVVEVADGSTVLDAAGVAGVDIPTLCRAEGLDEGTSCMVCMVRDEASGKMIPSCSAAAIDGMKIVSDSEDVLLARRSAVEMLLADHLGDCIAPCQSACPAGLEIPDMLRLVADGKMREAHILVREHLPIPAILGRICPAPCRAACRRKPRDGGIDIPCVHQFLADADISGGQPYIPACDVSSGKRVAIVGSGPAGLAAAYFLLKGGHECVILDGNEKPGGSLRSGVPRDELPESVLDAEISIIEQMGAEFRCGQSLGSDVPLADLMDDFDAVVLSIGETAPQWAEAMGLKGSDMGIETSRQTYETGPPGLFAAGAASRRYRTSIQSVADGRKCALAVNQYLAGQSIVGAKRPFSVHIGKLLDGEMEIFLDGIGDGGDEKNSEPDGDMNETAAKSIAHKCLLCDCVKAENCKLRGIATEMGASATKWKIPRRKFSRVTDGRITFEPAKCIKCGICVRLCEKLGQGEGMTFIGRGFGMEVTPPPGSGLEAMSDAAVKACAEQCPTAALSMNERGE